MTAVRAARILISVVSPSADLRVFGLLVVAVAMWDAFVRPSFFDECYALALVFQMFAASTGFRERAVRGHFDSLLTRTTRVRVAAGHLLASVAPGLFAWALVGCVDAVVLRRVPTGAHPSAVVALLAVSLIAWAGGLALPRYGAAILWLFGIVVIAGSGYAGRIRGGAIPGGPLTGWTARTAGLVAAPMLLVGDRVAPPAFTLAAVAACAIVVALLGLCYVARFDAALQEIA